MSPTFQIILAGFGTYLIRISALAFSDRFGHPSPKTDATLRLIAPAVLAAIVADRLFLVDGERAVQWDWWLAGLAAGLAAWKFRTPGRTMIVAMVAVWLFGQIL